MFQELDFGFKKPYQPLNLLFLKQTKHPNALKLFGSYHSCDLYSQLQHFHEKNIDNTSDILSFCSNKKAAYGFQVIAKTTEQTPNTGTVIFQINIGNNRSWQWYTFLLYHSSD